jgi:hypothetical protein
LPAAAAAAASTLSLRARLLYSALLPLLRARALLLPLYQEQHLVQKKKKQLLRPLALDEEGRKSNKKPGLF